MKIGYNRSGTQRCMYKERGTRYTIAPKTREYPEEARELTIKMTTSGSAAVEWENVWNEQNKCLQLDKKANRLLKTHLIVSN